MASAGEAATGERLSTADVGRYSRQMLVPGFLGGASGQILLKSSSALVVGCGGLGCPAAMYLAGAGVGTLTLVDDDVVAESNLHRQVSHTTKAAQSGTPKADSLAAAVTALNPHVRVVAVRSRFGSSDDCGLELVKDHSVVLDCTDNPGSRYLVGDACALSGTPLVSAAALGCNGQLSVYGFSGGPCYRCAHPAPPPRLAVGSCDEQGVLGPVTGAMGSLQALEAIKVIVGADPELTLSGRLLVMDASDMRLRTVRMRGRRADCPACGRLAASWSMGRARAFLAEHGVPVAEGAGPRGPGCTPCKAAAETAPAGTAAAEAASVADAHSKLEVPVSVLMPLATGAAGAVGTASYMPLGGRARSAASPRTVDVNDGRTRVCCVVLDVRSGVQRGMCRLPLTLHAPLASLRAAAAAEPGGAGASDANAVAALRAAVEAAGAAGVVAVCRRGVDSLEAAKLLSGLGVRSWSARGGLVAFARECDPSFPSY